MSTKWLCPAAYPGQAWSWSELLLATGSGDTIVVEPGIYSTSGDRWLDVHEGVTRGPDCVIDDEDA